MSALVVAAVPGTGLAGSAGTAAAASPDSVRITADHGDSVRITAGEGVGDAAAKPLKRSFYRAYWSESACVSEGRRASPGSGGPTTTASTRGAATAA